MAEHFDLTAPITPPTRMFYTITLVVLDWTAQVVQVRLTGSDGTEVRAEYTGGEATAFMTTLNTANFTTVSLHNRILQRLRNDGKLPAGTVSGTPA